MSLLYLSMEAGVSNITSPMPIDSPGASTLAQYMHSLIALYNVAYLGGTALSVASG